MTGLITLLVFLALTITMIWTKPSPSVCERKYKDCRFFSGEMYQCHFRRLQCLYSYCVNIVKMNKVKRKSLALRLTQCLTKYGIPSPMWIDLSK